MCLSSLVSSVDLFGNKRLWKNNYLARYSRLDYRPQIHSTEVKYARLKHD